jgi:DnaJ homolog subfamily A member 2
LTHLDGRKICIKTRPGQIIQCETTDEETGRTLPYIVAVKDEGMPSRGNPFIKGSLYIAFHVQFPTTLPKETIDALRTLLPNADLEQDFDEHEVEEHFLEAADLRHFGKGGAHGSNGADAYDSDEEGAGGGQQGVQCQQS